MTIQDDNPTPTTTTTKRKGWTAYIPRPGSSSGRPGSSSGRPGSSGGFRSASTTDNTTSPVQPRPVSFVGSFGKRPGSSNGFKFKEVVVPILASPQEGKELNIQQQQPTLVAVPTPALSTSNPLLSPILSPLRLPTRSSTADGPSSPPVSRPTTPKRWASNLMLTTTFSSPKPNNQELAQEADQNVNNAIERTASRQQESTHTKSSSKSYLSSMMGGLSLSLSRTNTRDSTGEEEKDKDRGRSIFKSSKRQKSSSRAAPEPESRSQSRARSQSPFFFRRLRRETSPTPPQPLPLANSETDLSDTSSSIHPRNAFTDDQDSGDETIGETDYSDDDYDEIDDYLDPVTERNTEQNAVISLVVPPDGVTTIDGEEPDPLGEGVNVVVPPEPYFPSSLNALGNAGTPNKRNTRRRKSVKHHEPLHFHTSRPNFQRDRCTITVTQGDPVAKLGDRRKRKYIVASDLSEESRYAVEWGIGTVLRDGDEMLLVTVVENESKVDPENPNTVDRSVKLRSQQERQGLAYILVRQVTGLLQRTKLNVIVSCQAWHSKNARHILLDIVDYHSPTMLIVGSRGLGQLNGILLGSTSHYLIQKCSVPVMVARRRLKRPPKKSAHLSTHRQHVKLSEAGIDRVAAKVDQDVKVMRDEIQKEDNRRDGGPGSRDDRRGIVNGHAEGPEELLEQDEDEEEADGEEGSGENVEEDGPIEIKVTG